MVQSLSPVAERSRTVVVHDPFDRARCSRAQSIEQSTSCFPSSPFFPPTRVLCISLRSRREASRGKSASPATALCGRTTLAQLGTPGATDMLASALRFPWSPLSWFGQPGGQGAVHTIIVCKEQQGQGSPMRASKYQLHSPATGTPKAR